MKIVQVISIIGLVIINTSSQSVTDIEGNSYNTVIIGTQVWFKENLKVTRYNDNTPIANVADSIVWSSLSTAAYCDWGNEPDKRVTYGALYNWYVVNNHKGICPVGWHVPNDGEWSALTDYLGGDSIAGSHLKETGNIHWAFQNTDADNSSGFTALPSGHRHRFGSFATLGYYAFWWSSTENGFAVAWNRYVSYNNSAIGRSSAENVNGFCIRCIRDLPIMIKDNFYTNNHLSNTSLGRMKSNCFHFDGGNYGYVVSIYNCLGQVVYKIQVGKGQKIVDFGFLPKASYILCILHRSGTIRKSVVIY